MVNFCPYCGFKGNNNTPNAAFSGLSAAMLLGPDDADAPAPLFDTTGLHARSVARWTLGDEKSVPNEVILE